ncbi:MAG: hypothetical protein ACI9SQ_001668 [Rubritalea sp.]|jgi:hypothetical protein
MSKLNRYLKITISSILFLSLPFTIVSCSKEKAVTSTAGNTEETTTEASKQDSYISKHETVSLDTPLSFNEHIQPILSVNCYHCHGPDSGTRLPEDEPLRLDSAEGAFAIRDSGNPIIVKGDPDNSYLIELMESKDPDQVMPLHPSRSPHGRVMDPADIALVRRWVKEGANYEKHWAYIAPKKSELPTVKNKDWIRNPIDHFVLSKLEKNNLTPNPEEDKARLLRRLSLDLTGLAPTPKEVTDFLADTRDFDEVYSEKVDQLLKTDSYAEHFARHWLDVARYADTHGIHIDNYRSIWPYRDWVINAFRDNMKFDQFTLEQIAGDMLPNATLEQKIATGFHRCLPTTGEGGAIAEEYDAIYAQDRVDTTSAAWLGLTAGCAACHDHKFDAISTKENYQLTAFFRNTTMSALDRNNALHPPNILVPLKNDRKLLAEAKKITTSIEEQQKQIQIKLEPAFQTWVKQSKNTPTSSAPAAEGVLINLPLNDKKNGINHPTYKSKLPLKWKNSELGDAVLFTDSNEINLGKSGDFEYNKPFSFGAWIYAPDKASGSIVSKMSSKDNQRGYDLSVEKGKLVFRMVHKLPKNLVKVSTSQPFKANRWMHIMVTYNGARRPSGVNIYINGKSQQKTNKRFKLQDTIKNDAPLILGNSNLGESFNNGQLQHFQLYKRALNEVEINNIAAEAKLRLGKLNKDQLNEAKQYFFTNISDATSDINSKLSASKKDINDIEARGTRTLIMDVKPNQKPTAHVLIRGDYAIKDKEVLAPNVPASLPPMTEDMPKNRLGLAMWLTDKSNPLPARVTANRYWYYLFGTGIVETNKDFGTMGARPTHPKLLDYLAADFMEHDWDFHRLLKQIVTSSTYRQSSVLTAEKKFQDPLNKLLSRGPRYRMDAEQLRDLALSSSKLLHTEIGGPSVKPYQPTNIWQAVAMPQSNTKLYKPDSGNKLYRRSLYTFWKRTAMHPTMEILNAPNREESCVQRELTNTPLQAFVIMNDPQFVEASRQLAATALQNASSTEERINFIALTLLSREMEADEIDIIKTTLSKMEQKFKATPASAGKLISVGETKAPEELDPRDLASWTVIANQILNMDETLNK